MLYPTLFSLNKVNTPDNINATEHSTVICVSLWNKNVWIAEQIKLDLQL